MRNSCRSRTRFILIPVLFFCLSSFSFAELATDIEMQQVCRNWLVQTVVQRGSWNKSATPEIIESDDIRGDNGVVLAKYYTIDPGGFVLIPALKEMRPVKAYSEIYTLNEFQEEGFLKMISDVLHARFELYERLFGSLDSRQSGDARVFGEGQRSLWDMYTLPTEEFLAVRAAEKDYIEEAGPLLTSSWHQHEPYNNLCPMGDGDRTVVGCVATATSQILNYWQWPSQGRGTHSFYWYGDRSCGSNGFGDVLSADYSNPYDWGSMVDSCDDGCQPSDSAALAELCYEVGIAYEMDYGVCGSSATTSDALTVMPTFFNYSRDITRKYRSPHTLVGWYYTMKAEIDDNRVALYRIKNHAIVVDGYRADMTNYEYHMNYGWGNSFSAWYILDSLFCAAYPDSICPADEEYVITNIYPQYTPDLHPYTWVTTELSGDGDSYCDAGDTIDLSMTIENDGGDAVGSAAELSTDDSYISVIDGSVQFDSFIPWGVQSTGGSDFRFSIDPACPDPHQAMLFLTITADGGYSSLDTIYIYIGNTTGLDEDMESDVGSWRHQKMTPGYGDEWHIESYRAHSGTTSWKVGGPGAGVYSDTLDAGLMSPLFLLPPNATLSFWHWIDAEAGDTNSAWDGAIVMYGSGDGNWTQIYPDSGYPYFVIDFTPNPFTDYMYNPFEALTPCFSGFQDWEQITFDLSAYSGIGQLLFRFGSDDNTTLEGWYIDDVQITGDFVCGDANGDTAINIGDAVLLINYIFKGGAAPDPIEAGDANGDGGINVGDAVFLINHIFNGGPAPSCL